jgi:hypothetical protein
VFTGSFHPAEPRRNPGESRNGAGKLRHPQSDRCARKQCNIQGGDGRIRPLNHQDRSRRVPAQSLRRGDEGRIAGCDVRGSSSGQRKWIAEVPPLGERHPDTKVFRQRGNRMIQHDDDKSNDECDREKVPRSNIPQA